MDWAAQIDMRSRAAFVLDPVWGSAECLGQSHEVERRTGWWFGRLTVESRALKVPTLQGLHEGHFVD